MFINWRAGLHTSVLVRIKNKAVIARLIYKRPDAKISVRMALILAKFVEESFYTEAISEHDYLRRVSVYIQSIPHTPETFEAALDVTSQWGGPDRYQLCPDLSEESPWEAFMLRFWILLEGLSWFDAPARAQIWPRIERILALFHSQARAARQQLQQQQQQPLAGLPSEGNTILPPQQQPQQQQSGPSELQKEIDDGVMAFLNQIQ